MRVDARLERGEIVLALTAADDLAVALRREDVDAEREPGIGGVGLHVEGLARGRVAVDHHGTIEALREHGLLVAAEVVAEGHRLAFAREDREGLLVAQAWKRLLDALERDEVALERHELALPLLDDPAHDLDQKVLGERHVVVEVGEGNLGLDHPELGQVAPRLRLLGAERRAEAVDLAERHRAGLHVELAALRQVGRRAEVVDREERGGSLAGGGGEDRRVEEREAAAVEVFAAGAHDAGAHPHDGVLARRAQPEMAVVEEERGSVLLRRDRIVDGLGEQRQVTHRELIAERRAGVGAHGAGHLDGRLLCEPTGALEQLRGDVLHEHDALDRPRAVAQEQEVELAARASVVQPAPQRHVAARVARDVLDVDVHASSRKRTDCAHGRIGL